MRLAVMYFMLLEKLLVGQTLIFPPCVVDLILIFTIHIKDINLKKHYDGHIVFSKVTISNLAVHTVTMT